MCSQDDGLVDLVRTASGLHGQVSERLRALSRHLRPELLWFGHWRSLKPA